MRRATMPAVDAGDSAGALGRALAELDQLREENARLRRLLATAEQVEGDGAEPVAPAPGGTKVASDSEKIAIFQTLFRGRDDVFAIRWEARDGRTGYAPANRYDHGRGAWRAHVERGVADTYVPMSETVLRDHLVGKHAIGIYPLLPDEMCWLLAIDFDKAGWGDDVLASLAACDEMGIPASLERSRSGRGAHVWIFFDQPLAAAQARRLGSAILTSAMERRHQMGLDSYDRLFPNQDTLPRGGFGNLIALPLQRRARAQHNTEFLDRDLAPFEDQWAYLASVRRVGHTAVELAVREAARRDGLIGVRLSVADEAEDDPWIRPPSRRRADPAITDPLPTTLRVTLGNLLYIEKRGLPAALLNRLARLAAFQNPEFYKAQAMQLSTFGKPRVISCSEEFPEHLGLPRGCLAETLELLQRHGIWATVADERIVGEPVALSFCAELSAAQRTSAQKMLEHDIGVLSAPTAFGKTVIGAWLIAQRGVNTLVVVHRQHLLDQWRERLSSFLAIPVKQIGQIGAGKRRPAGLIDIALLQSLQRKGEVDDVVAGYGQVIVDECHHIPAFTFERVLREVKARYVVGLTATPVRKDGHHPIVIMQCGPIRHRVAPLEQAAARPFEHLVVPRRTAFNVPPESEARGIQHLYSCIAHDGARNDLICADVLSAVQQGRSPLVLTERTDHLELLAGRLRPDLETLVVMRGGMGVKRRKAAIETLTQVPPGATRVLLATGRYIGEAFDDARLDTLFLAMPVSWRGTIQQYAGRLHRLHADKTVVVIYDYVDGAVPVLWRMHQRRLKGCAAIGYSVSAEDGAIAHTSTDAPATALMTFTGP